MICGSGGSKSRLAKAAGAEPAGQMRDEKLHAVVARSTFPSQNVQNTSCSGAFGSWDVEKVHAVVARSTLRSQNVQLWTTFGRCEKVHAVVARSTFRSQNVQNTSALGALLEVAMSKKCTPLWREAHFEVKMYKHLSSGALLEVALSKKCTPLWREAHFEVKMYKTPMLGALLEVEMSKKCTPLWREAHFEVKMLKKHHMLGPLLVVQMSFRVAGARDCAPCQKWAKREGFVAFPKTMAGVGHLKRICKDAFSVAGAVQETCSSELLGGPALISWEGLHFGASDLQVCWDDFAWQVQHFVWPGITFSWQAQYFRQVEWKNRKTHWYEAVSSALNFPFLKEVSQNCFVFDVVNFEKWGSLAELLRFWRCQVQKLRKSRRIAAFLMLSSSKPEEVSQNSFVFKLADRQIDR